MAYDLDILAYFARLRATDAQAVPDAARGMLQLRPFVSRKFDRKVEAAQYIPNPGLTNAIQTAIALGRPLLLTGEPGTGKTMAAFYVARTLDLGDVIRFQVKSDSRARDLLYSFDDVARFKSQDGQAAADTTKLPQDHPLFKFVTKGPLWLAFDGGPRVLLIDEIDKASRDFPNDLLREFEDLSFRVDELGPSVDEISCDPGRAPIVVITSNGERRLPEPFLRRVIFHHIRMTPEEIDRIIRDRVDQLGETQVRGEVLDNALACFVAIWQTPQLEKRPAVDEFWSWLTIFDGATVAAAKHRADLKRVAAEFGLKRERLRDLPGFDALVKSTDDQARIA